ncbi:unnamed protein product [Prorocentrum cordatum]|uniref:Uncharacterized protein n=1 Tax=Prorocentrum cordatum TaxID=2364126 RepID=A0ABN9SJM8_9DINO|nr:unnamed protein product [Polarella glacialis]
MSFFGRSGSFMASGPRGGFVAGSRGSFAGGGGGGALASGGAYSQLGYSGGGVYPGDGVYPGMGYADADCGNGCGADGCGVGAGGGACCGVGGASCGGGIAGTTMSYVGAGGDYVATTTYQYVGQGAGTFAVVPIPAAGCSVWWLCCLWWLALIPFIFFAGTTTTTTTTTPPIVISTPPPETPPPVVNPTPAPPPPQGPPRICKIYGDPHVTTFDGSHASFYSQGEYWVVKSSTVWIQGRYLPTPVTNGLSVLKEVAIGGPFLEGKNGEKNLLRISALSATFNGVPIIPSFPDAWENRDPMVKVVTDGNGQVMQSSRAGKQLHVVHVDLPLNVHLEINRWNEPGEGDYLNTMITMGMQPNQDGHCGNISMATQTTTPGHRSAPASAPQVLRSKTCSSTPRPP